MLTDYFYIHLRQSFKLALPLNSTTETIAITLGDICQIPGVNPALLGVVNQRGKLLWVLDLSVLFQLPISGIPWRSQDSLTLVVLSDRDRHSDGGTEIHQVGCAVSTLKAIVPLDSSAFQPVSQSIFADWSSYISNTNQK
jgi:twitching motility protein PilI